MLVASVFKISKFTNLFLNVNTVEETKSATLTRNRNAHLERVKL